ncbi:RpiB/LacA/LacB family sugar-phosphate isomerase [Candidatus Parcubacteria bacterium]|nr:RpiB/LacA/LacB family sugar-phosphate isomerase [Candidatus Parcubacteria bacterium]
MKIYFGADHAGYELKSLLKRYAQELGHEVVDCGNHNFEPDDNYPDFVVPVARAMTDDDQIRGVVIGGSGQGEAMAANKIPLARAAVYYGAVLPKQAVDITGRVSQDKYEIIRLSRSHNDSNVLSFGARFVDPDEAKECLKIWLETPFSNTERYVKRIKQVEAL